MSDPRFPNRPDHDDFWLISQALIGKIVRLAQKADSGYFGRGPRAALTTIISRIVDMASLEYAASQRVLRMMGQFHLDDQMRSVGAGLWIDGFIAGAEYQRLKAKENKHK